MEKSTRTGGCYCGKIRYEIDEAPRLSANCHCNNCRRAVGAQSVAWLIVKKTGFRWTNEKPTRYRTGTGAYRTFCPGCGSSLTYESPERTHEIDITAGSCDHPEDYPPTADAYLKYRLPWVKTI